MALKQDEVICLECELTCAVPVLGKCPWCQSRQIRRLTDDEKHARLADDVERIKAVIAFHLEKGDTDLADGYAAILATLTKRESMSSVLIGQTVAVMEVGRG